MNPLIVYGGILAGEYIYHRFKDEFSKGSDVTPEHARTIQIPLVADGSPVPMYFGRCRVRAPILAACGSFGVFGVDSCGLRSVTDSGISLMYGLDMLFVLGIPFFDGVQKIHKVWAGETEMAAADAISGLSTPLDVLTGAGSHEQPHYMTTPGVAMDAAPSGGQSGKTNLQAGSGLLEFLNGNSSQELITTSLGFSTSKTYTADRLTTLDVIGDVPPLQLGNYRGYTAAFMFSGAPLLGSDIPFTLGDPAPWGFPATPTIHARWLVGPSPQAPAYSFEVSSYPGVSLSVQKVGLEANPADVLYAIFRDRFAKLGLPAGRVDYESFRAAAETLYNEGHGYSRCFEGLTPASDMVLEILKQIDGAIDEDPYDGLIKLKLIRADFNPATIQAITADNCEELQYPAAGGWVGLANKIRVMFPDRANDYREGPATAQNPANAVGQDGEVSEIVLQFPGVCTETLAKMIAGRELAALSRPIAKFKAIVDRTFWRTMVGDPIAVTWPEYNISGRIFRVARVSRGTADSNTMDLDLIEDFFYTHRFETTDTGGLPTHSTTLVV